MELNCLDAVFYVGILEEGEERVSGGGGKGMGSGERGGRLASHPSSGDAGDEQEGSRQKAVCFVKSQAVDKHYCKTWCHSVQSDIQ